MINELSPSLAGPPKGGAKRLLRVLGGERLDRPPLWIMRQAGRYLPEFRELRRRAPHFMDFCYAPALATEAALQPLRRFPLDASILFSDILVVPDALGRTVTFVEGEGPRLAPLIEESGPWRFTETERALQRLAPVYETVERTRAALPQDVTFIGFAGAPWTVATYMLQGRGGEKDLARRAAYTRPEDVDALLAVLVETTAHHLAAQAKAGVEALQVFESWAEGLPAGLFERLVIAPTRALVDRVRALGISVPIIGFPRGAGTHYARYAAATGVTALGLDTSASARALAPSLPAGMARQGNLDPLLLVVGGAALERGVAACLAEFADSPHVFNLGHGITPDASPDHVARLAALVRGEGSS